MHDACKPLKEVIRSSNSYKIDTKLLVLFQKPDPLIRRLFQIWGTTSSFLTEAVLNHSPVLFDSLIFVNPASVILASSIIFQALFLLASDHLLLALRGVNFWINFSSSIFFTVLSIQPKHNASSTASLYGIPGLPVCFL